MVSDIPHPCGSKEKRWRPCAAARRASDSDRERSAGTATRVWLNKQAGGYLCHPARARHGDRYGLRFGGQRRDQQTARDEKHSAAATAKPLLHERLLSICAFIS